MKGRSYAVDASVLLEITFGSDLAGKLISWIDKDDISFHATTISIAEVRYILCRHLGRDEAEVRVRKLLNSGVISVESDDELWISASDCKCALPISLGDCFTLSLGKVLGISPLFLRMEREFENRVGLMREWVGREIVFANDVVQHSD